MRHELALQKALIAHLDTPLESGGDTQVRYLQFADAEKIATKLKEQISATVAITGAAPAGGAPGGGAVAASADRSTTIWAEPETNALVPLDSHAERARTPTSKSIPVCLRPAADGRGR